MDRYLLIERDGVISIRREAGITKPEEMVILPFVPEALFTLEQRKIKAIILSDQSSISPSQVDAAALEEIDEKMKAVAEEMGGRIADIITCPYPHTKNELCAFPQPGLFKIAAHKYKLNLPETHFIASSLDGLQAAWAAGCKASFVKTGKPYAAMQYFRSAEKLPEFIERDFLSVVVKIFPD